MKYHLNNEEVDAVTFKCELVTDRQDQAELIGNGGFHRWDMYWIRCTILSGGNHVILGSVCVNPIFTVDGAYEIDKNWCMVTHDCFPRLRDRIAAWFKEQPEYKQQCEWVNKLKLHVAA